MTAELSAISEKLSSAERRLSRLLTGFELVEADLLLVEEQKKKIFHCLDFHDLLNYLKFSGENPRVEIEDHDRAIENYVRILIVHNTANPLVLLPAYYAEFRSHISNRVFYSAGSEIRAELWLSRLRRKLKAEIQAPDGLFSYLETASKALGDTPKAAIDKKHVARLTRRLLAVIRDISPQLQEAQEAAVLVRKFDVLVRQGRLIGLSAALGLSENVKILPHDVQGFARRRLDELKRRKAISNQRDADALSTVFQANRLSKSSDRCFYLFSSAETLFEVVDKINRQLLSDREEHIRLRDLAFWSLWFAFSLRRAESRPGGLAEFTEFRKEFRPLLRYLYEECASIQDVLNEHESEVEVSEFLDELDGDVSVFHRDLKETLRDIAEPILDPKWRLEVLSDALSPASGDETVDSALNLLKVLLERIEYQAGDLAKARSDLEKLAQKLNALIRNLEVDVSESLDSLSRARESFSAGGVLDFCLLRSPYRRLLLRLELEGATAVKRIRSELEKLKSIESESIETLALEIMTSIYAGEGEAANRQLQSLKKRYPSDWSCVYLEALNAELSGDLDRAIAGYEEVSKIADNARFSLHLARLHWVGYSRSPSLGGLHVVENYLVKAFNSYESGNYAVRASLVTLAYESVGEFGVNGLSAISTLLEESGRERVGRLVRQAPPRHVPKAVLVPLEEILQRRPSVR